MSFTKTTLTARALELNTQFITGDKGIDIVRVVGGTGDTDPSSALAMVDESISLSLRSEIAREGKKLTLPIFYENNGVTAPIQLSEIGVYVKDEAGESLYALSKSNPPIPIPPILEGRFELFCNLIIELANTATVTFTVTSMTFITRDEAVELFAPKSHRHPATQIDESTGETTEQAQRRQDAAIDFVLKNYGGSTEIWRFGWDELARFNIVRGVVDGARISTGGGV